MAGNNIGMSPLGNDKTKHRVLESWTAPMPPTPISLQPSPAAEYHGFSTTTMGSMQIPPASMLPPSRTMAGQQAPHLMVHVPHRWPSQLAGRYNPNYPGHASMLTPLSAPASLPRTERPRKTLTDTDRRRMCQYAEDFPTTKQTEIGALFGVERSTVSKVLRNKEKYLQGIDPTDKSRSRLLDVERQLSSWVKQRQRESLLIDDSLLEEQLKHVVASAGTRDAQQALIPTWFESFKHKHYLLNSAYDPSELRDDSVMSPSQKRELSPSRRRSLFLNGNQTTKTHKRIKSQSPTDMIYPHTPPSLLHHRSFGSISGALSGPSMPGSHTHHSSLSSIVTSGSAHPSPYIFTHSASPYALSPVRTNSPYYTSHPFDSQSPMIQTPLSAPPNANSQSFRPRSSTFPLSAGGTPMDGGYVSPSSSGSEMMKSSPHPMESQLGLHESRNSAGLSHSHYGGLGNHLVTTSMDANNIMATTGMDAHGIIATTCMNTSNILTSSETDANSMISHADMDTNLLTSSELKSHTVTPDSDLSDNILTNLANAGAIGLGSPAPSAAETQEALQVVINFFSQQQALAPDEYLLIGRLMEKLKLRRPMSTVPEDFEDAPLSQNSNQDLHRNNQIRHQSSQSLSKDCQHGILTTNAESSTFTGVANTEFEMTSHTAGVM